MQISGNYGKTRVTNPLLFQNNKAAVSFSGHTLSTDNHGKELYTFYIPNMPKNANAEVEIVALEKNPDGVESFSDREGDFTGFSRTKERYKLNSDGTFKMYASERIKKDFEAIGYRFLLNGKHPYLDYNRKININGSEYNIATPIYRAGHMNPRQMEHLYPDSLVLDLNKEKRNHFNHLGGTLKSIIDVIPDFKEFGVRRILSTPIFGQDTLSSHGYWTVNPYQITSTLGDMNDYKKMQIELFKNGMGWVADGAFVNEGLMGIHVKDITNWGDESPFLNWFSTCKVGDMGMKFAILPKNLDAQKHVHVKLVNAKHKILWEKIQNGDEVIYREAKIVPNPKYRATKPTFIQLFDDRLVTDKQLNEDVVFKTYGKKNAADKHQINNYKDSVQPYAFRVSPDDAEANYRKYKGTQRIDSAYKFKNNLLKWTNFQLVTSNGDGGIGTWVGNTDIPKKRFMVSTDNYYEKDPVQCKEIEASQYQVQDDTIQVGKFWSSETARTLLEYTAEAIAEKFDKLGSYEQAVRELISEGKLPKSAEVVLEKNNGTCAVENVLNVDVFGNRGYKLKPTGEVKNVTEGLMAYPPDAIEFSQDLCSVLAYPYLKNYAVTPNTVGKSRYELFKMGEDFYQKMPEKFQEQYKKMDAFIAGTNGGRNMTSAAIDLLREAGKRAGLDIVDEKGGLTEFGKTAFPIIAPDLAKFMYVSLINPKIKPVIKEKRFGYEPADLEKTTIESLSLQYALNPEDAADKLRGRMQGNVKRIPKENKEIFLKWLSEKITNFDEDTVSVAKLIIEKTESGLDWRIDAAKDVGDWDGVESNTLKEKDCFDNIAKFWKDFNTAVRTYNPKAYTIGELVQDQEHDYGESGHRGPFEYNFNNRTGFTTQTDYNYMFSAPMELFGTNLESSNHNGSITDKTLDILGRMLPWGLQDNVNFMHVFVGNHDKPRPLHSLCMDMELYAGNDKRVGDKAAAMVKAISLAMDKNPAMEKIGKYRDLIFKSLNYLKQGKYLYKGQWRKFDAENFGVRPFDMNIDDMFEQAKEYDVEFKKFADENPKEIEYVKAKILEKILEGGMKRYTSLLFYMVGMPGTPTVYAGDELGESGWETLAKNEYQNNRQKLHFERLKDENYSFIKNYRNNLGAIMNIRNQKAASPLVNGNTIPLAPIGLNGGGSAAVVYRYDDKSEAICVFHNEGYEPNKPADQIGYNKQVDSISLEQNGSTQGLPYGLKNGTIYYNALNPVEKYVVKNGKIVNTLAGTPINLGNRGIILLREKGFDGEEFLKTVDNKPVISFKGRKQNPNVKIANMKYNIV